MKDIAVGDAVAYSVQFLKSIGMSHTDMGRGRGRIVSIKTLGREPNCTSIATVAWENGADLPERVNVANLAIVGPNRRFCNCD